MALEWALALALEWVLAWALAWAPGWAGALVSGNPWGHRRGVVGLGVVGEGPCS